MTIEKNLALVVFSGGQDSTTCLYWAFDKFSKENVRAVSFDYGQRHKVELIAAKKICQLTSIEHTILPINTFNALGGNSLTGQQSVDNALNSETSLPNTFVPGRNLIFLSFAASLAYQLGIKHLVTGVAQTDYSGYPDCRESTIQSLQNTINLGMESDLIIHTPLMFLSKKQTVLLAEKLGAMPALAHSHTCYNGVQPGCGKCAACILRAKGFAQAGINDPLFI
ncbi:MAG: 7-cyano-7-deazaguanine synthase QueC [Pseudomonadota bacterium]